MAGKRSRAVAVAAPSKVTDDFTLIKGIGPATERHLHDAGILTYAQLAALTPESLAARVADFAGLSAKRIAKQGWIRQARKLASKPVPTKSYKETAALRGRQHYATFTVELLLAADNDVRRTRVVHVQGGDEDAWAGWEDARLLNFFIQRAGLPPQLTQPAPPLVGMVDLVEEPGVRVAQPAVIGDTRIDRTHDKTGSPAEASTPEPSVAHSVEARTQLQLDVGDMWLVEVPIERQIDRPAFAKRIRARMNFQLSGVEVERVTARQSQCLVQILACDLATGQTTVLAADRQQLRPGVPIYTTTVEFALPGVGRYQLLGMVLLSDNKIVEAALGPVLRVIP